MKEISENACQNRKFLKRGGWLISSILLGTGLLTGAYYFLNIEKRTQWRQIIVKGEKRENGHDQAVEKRTKQSSATSAKAITFQQLLAVPHPEAPRKKTNAGNFYVRARSAIAIDVETGTILFYQEARKHTAIASLTKMMTAILVVEKISNLDQEAVTIDREAVLAEGTKIGCPRSGYCISNRLRVGEKISAKSLLEAMLMNSANDAAIALGKHLAGSQANFAELMNKKAKEIGLRDTYFCNPSGLDEDDRPGQCYSSAYDLARIAAYSLKYQRIWDIMKIKEKEIYSLDGKIKHRIVNTDRLLETMPNCIGGKTGFTYEAGKSLMTAAHHPNNRQHKVIAVILDDNWRWEDMKKLMDWVFTVYVWP